MIQLDQYNTCQVFKLCKSLLSKARTKTIRDAQDSSSDAQDKHDSPPRSIFLIHIYPSYWHSIQEAKFCLGKHSNQGSLWPCIRWSIGLEYYVACEKSSLRITVKCSLAFRLGILVACISGSPPLSPRESNRVVFIWSLLPTSAETILLSLRLSKQKHLHHKVTSPCLQWDIGYVHRRPTGPVIGFRV